MLGRAYWLENMTVYVCFRICWLGFTTYDVNLTLDVETQTATLTL